MYLKYDNGSINKRTIDFANFISLYPHKQNYFAVKNNWITLEIYNLANDKINKIFIDIKTGYVLVNKYKNIYIQKEDFVAEEIFKFNNFKEFKSVFNNIIKEL